jgi:hypothetical protein
MTPEFESRLRASLPLLLLGVLVLLVVVGGRGLYHAYTQEPLSGPLSVESKEQHSVGAPEPVVPPEPAEPALEWLYVNQNNVLLWPVIRGECRNKSALMQVHIGTKVLVVHRHGEWVEIEQDDQSALHTHGCIHEAMLVRDDD